MKAFVSTLGICAVALFAAGGCGSDDDDGGGGSGGSTGGSGGSTGGSGGSTGGSGGSTGGAAGAATGGAAGAATGGSAGAATGGSAGATGGLSCAAYCALIQANCTGNNKQYDNEGACTTACGAWPEGTAADQTGNTLGCHTYHATAAGADPDTHCDHAGPTGGGVCVD